MAEFSVDGLDDLIGELEDLEHRARELDGEKDVAFSELFTDDVIQRKTSLTTFSDLKSASGFDWGSQEAYAAIPDDQLDAFVRTVSAYDSFDEMAQEAGMEYVKRHMGF